MRKSIRKLAACLCLWTLLGSSLTVPARAAGFTDVPSGHWAAEAVSQCVSRGWFQGKSADTFGVGQPMTRGGLCRGAEPVFRLAASGRRLRNLFGCASGRVV